VQSLLCENERPYPLQGKPCAPFQKGKPRTPTALQLSYLQGVRRLLRINMFKIHRPPHYYLDETIYFISSSALNKASFFDSGEKKIIIQNFLSECLRGFNCELYAWTILPNHYHLLFKIANGKDLTQFVRELHSKSAIAINKMDNKPGRQIWYNYWDTCIRSEKDFWMRFNYIYQNAVKHGYVRKMEDYKFSSYNYYLKNKGQEWLDSCFDLYPIVDFILDND
jgi:putative transposase